MKPNESMRLAMEAGARWWPSDEARFGAFELQPAQLARFAELVAAAERERCAEVCEAVKTLPDAGPLYCAAMIRRRGEA
jgi:hypothetical protein